MYETILKTQRTPKNLYSQGLKLGLSAIEPTQLQELRGVNFKTSFAPRDVEQRKEILPFAKKIINILKKSHPGIAKKASSPLKLREELFKALKKQMPATSSYQELAETMVKELNKDSKIKKEMELLDYVVNIHPTKDNFNGLF